MLLRYLVPALLFFSCATGPEIVTKKEAPPFLKRYKKKNKELIYIVIDGKASVDQPTMKLIQATVKRFDPEIVVTKYPVEGSYRLEDDLSLCESNRGCSPAGWTCLVAKPRGIPCLTGEPFHTDILKRARRKQLKDDDVLFFYTFRSLVRTMKGKKSPLEGLGSILEAEKKSLNLASALDEDEFVRMYRDKMNSKTVHVGKSELRPKRDGSYIQRIAKVIEESHEELILEKIEKEQLGHERVMVVYDLEHYARHLEPLEDFFSGYLP